MPCASKPTCTHVIIILLWLICHIQCGFSISYLLIPGIAAHDRCNISRFHFFFSALMWCCVFQLFNYFFGSNKLGSVVGRRRWEYGFLIICFKIGLLNFSPCVYSLLFFLFFFLIAGLFLYMLVIRGKFTSTLLILVSLF